MLFKEKQIRINSFYQINQPVSTHSKISDLWKNEYFLKILTFTEVTFIIHVNIRTI